MFQDYTADRYGVHWIRTYFLGGGFHFPGGRDLYPGYRLHRDEKSYFGYQEVDEISSLLIETPVYLNTLLQDFRLAGGEIIIRPLTTARDMTGMKEKIIFNCTGLGAAQLFNDQEMIPVKGQLSVLLPQPEIDYAYVAHSPGNLLYMFPRKDGIVLGGTYDKGNWSLEPDENESLRILNGHAAIAEYLVRNFTL